MYPEEIGCDHSLSETKIDREGKTNEKKGSPRAEERVERG